MEWFTLSILAAEPVLDTWNGHVRETLQVAGRKAWLVAPAQPAPGRPWIWRARFFGHRPEVDLALLDKGYHLAYVDVAGLYGSLGREWRIVDRSLPVGRGRPD